jgi:aminopeptidase N
MVIGVASQARVDLGRTGCALGEIDPCVRQSVYVSPELRDYVPGPFGRAHEMVRTFAELVSAYPYEQLAHLQSSTRFGGMENATAIFYSDQAFRRRSVGLTLIAHEIAHQWFGNSVTPRDWPHVWLSEGFATYFAQLWHERFDGASAFRDGMRQIRETVVKAPVVAQRPVIDSTQADLLALLNANSYQKGGFVLHMLRDVVGDSAFFRGVRAYYRAGRHGTAVTDELRREMESETGRELRWFFDQWLRRPGYVEASTSWRHDPATGKVVVTIEQAGRFGAYRFPLEVALRGADGNEQRSRIEVPAERRAVIELAAVVQARPTAVAFDPDVKVLGVFTNR